MNTTNANQNNNVLDSVLAAQIEAGRKYRSELARPMAEAINAHLGHGVGPVDLAHRLAIVIEDNGSYRYRSQHIDSMASFLEITAKLLRAEAARRRNPSA